MKKIMRNKFFWTFVLGLVAFFPLFSRADFNLNDWRYFKEVSILEKGTSRIVLDEEIFSKAKENFSDLRLISEKNKEIPYELSLAKKLSTQEDYAVKLINNSYVSGKHSMVILDLQEKGKLINSLLIRTDLENFQRNVKVYGSDDLEIWNTLRDDAYIYDYTDKRGNFKSQNTSLAFPDSFFRYYKLEVSDQEESPIKIISVMASDVKKEKIQEIEKKIDFSVSENEEQKITQVILDLGQSGIPFEKMRIGIDDKNFNRQVLIYSSQDREKWDYVSRDYIFSYDTAKFKGEKKLISFNEIRKRFIKLEILNNDNASLRINSLFGFYIPREIFFQTEETGKFKLFYGNSHAVQPQYDFSSYSQYLDLESAKLVKISDQKDNPEYIKKAEKELPFSERIPFFLPIVLISVSMLLIILVYKFIKE
jgi:hypothetical protein